MDLISRKAAIETVKKLLYETALNSCGHHKDDEIYTDIAENRIEVWLGLVPSAPVVPLDKLCEWLEKNACYYQTEDNGGSTRFSLDACQWKIVLAKWMEEQDAAD